MNKGFYQPRASALHALHPLTKLIVVIALLLIGFLARTPSIPIALFFFAVLPLAAWGEFALRLTIVTTTIILPFALSIFLVQGLLYPGASAELVRLGPLTVKEQGLLFAYGTASRILLLAGAGLLLLFSMHPSDLMLALQERGLPAPLGYILLAAIQLLPQMQVNATAILDAQSARGLETSGSLLTRVRALIPLIAPLVFSALGQLDERAMALQARAFFVPQPKTSFEELRDTRAQSIARWVLVIGTLALGVVLVG